MAGAYENSIHQWRVIVVFVVDCVSVLTLDESAGKLYTIRANEAGSRAHKAAGASAPVVWSPKPLLRVRVLLPLPRALFLRGKGAFSISLTQEQNTFL